MSRNTINKILAISGVIFIAGFFALLALAGTQTHSVDFESTSSQYATVTGPSFGTSGTIEFWIDPEFDPEVSSSVGFVYDSTAGNRNLFYYNGNVDDWGLFIGNTSITDGAGSLAGLVDAGWTHVAIVWDDSASPTREIVYKNCEQFGTFDVSIGATTPTTMYVSASNGAANYYDGKLDDFRIWSDVRTPYEICNNYRTFLTGGEAGLDEYWGFNNALTTDKTSGGNDLTGVNSPTFTTDLPAWGPDLITTYNGVSVPSAKTINGVNTGNITSINGVQ